MTAIGVIILVTQIFPSVGYYPKEDMVFVDQFKPMAEELILENILRDEAGEGTPRKGARAAGGHDPGLLPRPVHENRTPAQRDRPGAGPG